MYDPRPTSPPVWKRNCSRFWWRYWAGYRWKRIYLNYAGTIYRYRTDKQHADALLAEQFDPDRRGGEGVQAQPRSPNYVA